MSSAAGRPPSAVRLVLLAAFCFSLMGLFVRLSGERLSSLQIVFVRSLMTLVLTLLLLRRAELSSWLGTHRKLLMIRGFVGFSALSCFFYSLTRLPLAEATVIQFTSPIWTAIIAWLYLKERASPRLWAAIFLGLAGILAITRPRFLFGGEGNDLSPQLLLVAFSGAILMSGAHVMVRRLAPVEHELVIILYFPLVATPVAAVAAVPVWIWPSAWEWLLLLAVGLAAQGGQVFLTRGMRHVTAAAASTLLYSQVVLAMVWGLLVLGERPDAWTIGGSFLVMFGTVMAARRPRVMI